jgi:hypothetical protein
VVPIVIAVLQSHIYDMSRITPSKSTSAARSSHSPQSSKRISLVMSAGPFSLVIRLVKPALSLNGPRNLPLASDTSTKFTVFLMMLKIKRKQINVVTYLGR